MEKPFKKGVVVGKFLPFHLGHDFLVGFAKERCEKLFVIVVYKQVQELNVELRKGWIAELHPDVMILSIDATHIPDWDAKLWARVTIDAIGEKPDAAFSSEDYGADWCRHMGCENVVVDKERNHFHVSGTMVRANPHEMLDLLPALVRRYYEGKIKRSAGCG